MAQKSLHGGHPATDRRPAIWPWVLMPLVALSLFFVLRIVRHDTRGSLLGPAAVSGDASSP
ncbi:MAG: hypothetical protein ACRETB_11705 [Steroidobacteraceae bacterium]